MDYREVVKKTINTDNDEDSKLLLAALGLCVESGEFADYIKKAIFHNQSFDRENMIKKLGDVRWFLELAAISLNTSIQEIESINTSKLMTRYPESFRKE